MQMEILKSYNRTELTKLDKIPYGRTIVDKDLYIPVKIETAQSRATAKGYTVRYLRRQEIEEYLNNNPKKERKEKNDYKYKKLLQKK